MLRGFSASKGTYLTLATLAVAPAACVPGEYSGNLMNAGAPYVLNRAVRDLACPSKQIQVVRGLGGRYTATGCGRRMTYQTSCEQLQCDVTREGERPAAWRDRPDPSSSDLQR
jgi:hypothetical protein